MSREGGNIRDERPRFTGPMASEKEHNWNLNVNRKRRLRDQADAVARARAGSGGSGGSGAYQGNTSFLADLIGKDPRMAAYMAPFLAGSLPGSRLSAWSKKDAASKASGKTGFLTPASPDIDSGIGPRGRSGLSTSGLTGVQAGKRKQEMRFENDRRRDEGFEDLNRELALRDKYERMAEERRLGRIRSLLSSSGGSREGYKEALFNNAGAPTPVKLKYSEPVSIESLLRFL